MNEHPSHCQTCFPNGALPRRETVANQHEALALFKKLFAEGKQPVLCQAIDASFRVCHETPPA
jgi:hypothetical protein